MKQSQYKKRLIKDEKQNPEILLKSSGKDIDMAEGTMPVGFVKQEIFVTMAAKRIDGAAVVCRKEKATAVFPKFDVAIDTAIAEK